MNNLSVFECTSIINHEVDGLTVGQQKENGYINATRLTQAHKQMTGQRRDVANWLSNKRVQETLNHLSLNTGKSVNELCKVVQGSPENGGGTWIHPDLLESFQEYLNKPSNKKPSFLYIIGDKQRNVCKIGVSSNPHERLKRIQTGYPWELDIWLEIGVKNAAMIERNIHLKFSDFKLRGEWFDGAVFKLLDLNEFKET